jgi:predicted kinase
MPNPPAREVICRPEGRPGVSPTRHTCPVDLDGIVVVAGVPGSGKTTLARELAPELGLPLLSKDTIKEALFDVLGSGDLATSQVLGRASHVVLYAVAAEARSAVVESHFWTGTSETELVALRRPLVQVYCRCPLELALERYLQRARSPSRHRGHLPEHQSEEAIRGWTSVAPRPLDLDAPLLEVDTTTPVDTAPLAAEIRRLLSSHR